MTRRPLLLLCVGLAGCASKKEEAPVKAVVEVKIAPAEEQDIRVMVSATATIFPREQSNVASRITAPITKMLVRKGDSVRAGQVLALLDSRDITAQREESLAGVADAQANLQKTVGSTLPADIDRARGQLQTAEAAYNQAKAIYEKRQDLFKQGAIPQRELLISQTDLATTKTNYEVAKRSLELIENQSRERDIKMAESRVSQAQARLQGSDAQVSYSKIVSPSSGTITEQFMYPGDMAKPDLPMFTVMDLSTAIARAQVPEAEAGALRAGQTCNFQSGDNAEAIYHGRVTVINRAVDAARRTVEVWCEIPKPPSTLRAGVFGQANILTGSTRGVMVPKPALQLNEGTHTGWVMTVDSKNIAHKREVEAGQIVEGTVQIVKGLKAGEKVIVQGAYGLPDGTEVKLAATGEQGK